MYFNIPWSEKKHTQKKTRKYKKHGKIFHNSLKCHNTTILYMNTIVCSIRQFNKLPFQWCTLHCKYRRKLTWTERYFSMPTSYLRRYSTYMSVYKVALKFKVDLVLSYYYYIRWAPLMMNEVAIWEPAKGWNRESFVFHTLDFFIIMTWKSTLFFTPQVVLFVLSMSWQCSWCLVHTQQSSSWFGA